jgi:hypothetical protein
MRPTENGREASSRQTSASSVPSSENAIKPYEIMGFQHHENSIAGSAMDYLRHPITQIAEGQDA